MLKVCLQRKGLLEALGQDSRNLPGKMDLSSAGISYLHETVFRQG